MPAPELWQERPPFRKLLPPVRRQPVHCIRSVKDRVAAQVVGLRDEEGGIRGLGFHERDEAFLEPTRKLSLQPIPDFGGLLVDPHSAHFPNLVRHPGTRHRPPHACLLVVKVEPPPVLREDSFANFQHKLGEELLVDVERTVRPLLEGLADAPGDQFVR